MRAAILFILALTGCRGAGPTKAALSQDSPTARLELDSMLARARMAHLRTDAALLAAGLADTLVSIDGGVITRQSRDSVRAMFDAYFAGAAYRAWDDVQPPVVHIADDNSLAWVARVVCVDREEPAPEGGRRRRTFVSAYSSTFARRNGRWEMTTVTSTFLATPPPACPPARQDALR